MLFYPMIYNLPEANLKPKNTFNDYIYERITSYRKKIN